MRIITLLCVLVCSACAVQTVDEPPTDDNVTDYPTAGPSEPGGGGMPCSKPLYFKLPNGETYYQPGLCPIPHFKRPEPDPARGIDKRDMVKDELISPEIDMAIGHENN